MRNIFSSRNSIYLFFLVVFISLLFGVIKLENKISQKTMEITTSDIISIANNSASFIGKILEKSSDTYAKTIAENSTLQKQLEDYFSLLITSNIKYVYLLHKDNRGIFRFLADGTIDKSNRACLNQKFDIDNPLWLNIFKTKKPLIIENSYSHQLSITYLVPILKENKVELILVVDFAISKLEKINEVISWIKMIMMSIILVVIASLLILIIQTFKYIAVKKTAYIDKLTGVYNRNYLQESEGFINLNDYILATLDIDYFKTVNDTYGHDVGDKVLKEMASVISLSTRDKEDIVIRYGGEEFVIMAKVRRDDSLGALNVIERILRNVRQYKFFYTKKDYIHMTVSIGINLKPNESRNFSDAFKLADIALYNAKNKGRNNIQIYDESKDNDGSMLSINDIKEALDEDRILCYYQKIINNNTNETTHYEALLRIVNKKGDIVLPDKILPIIEGTFISRNITKNVLRICSKKLEENENINININLRPKDLLDKSIIEILENYAKKQNISNRLGIEIIQNEDLINSKDGKNILLLLKDLGYKIFVDDFGSGYSNFIYLSEIKTDYIKIDGTIIKNILEDKILYLLVKSIISFAKEANIKVIAEHVNTKEIYEEIKALGIEYSQGYYFSSPKESLE
jgi:diguanylate cyclase (GGDEF)-like protein